MPTILTYHHIAPTPDTGENPGLFVSPESFERQLEHLKHSRTLVISLDSLRNSLVVDTRTHAGNQALITFDDGYLDNYDEALPRLIRHEFKAAFFITTGWIGGKSPEGHPMMNGKQIRELSDAGMTVGAHTVTHPWLAKIPLDEARRELADSKARLEDIIGREVTWLCYPSGSFNPQVQELARELGYLGACSVIRDNRMHAGQLFHLPRVMVMHDTTLLRFRYYFTGLYHWLHARKNRKRWAPYL